MVCVAPRGSRGPCQSAWVLLVARVMLSGLSDTEHQRHCGVSGLIPTNTKTDQFIKFLYDQKESYSFKHVAVDYTYFEGNYLMYDFIYYNSLHYSVQYYICTFWDL